MENLYLNELIAAVKGEFLIGDPHSAVVNVSIDTRTLRKGDYYFALPGKNFDGHDFLRQAIERQAGGIIISRREIDLGSPFPSFPAVIKVPEAFRALGDLAAYYRGKWNIPVTGVTGSNGKTTTREMLRSILSPLGPTLGTKGNLNNLVGLPLTIFNITSGHRFAVLEMGTSFPGEIRRLAEIAFPTVGIVTNIGFSHLENFGNREGVFQEKKQLLDSLGDGCAAVVNADDDLLGSYKVRNGCRRISFGIKGPADVIARDVGLKDGYPVFDLCVENTSVRVGLKMYGTFNVYNALAAAAAAWHLGVPLDSIRKGLENAAAPRMRMETIHMKSGDIVINDAYNANPTSVRQSLLGLAESFPGRDTVAVLGDMLELGPASKELHAGIGDFLERQPVNDIFLFGPLMAEAARGIKTKRVKVIARKEELERALKERLTGRTVVLFKGSRGMRLEDIINQLLSEEIRR